MKKEEKETVEERLNREKRLIEYRNEWNLERERLWLENANDKPKHEHKRV